MKNLFQYKMKTKYKKEQTQVTKGFYWISLGRVRIRAPCSIYSDQRLSIKNKAGKAENSTTKPLLSRLNQ